MDGGSADLAGLRKLPEAVTSLPVSQAGGAIKNESFPSDMTTFEFCPAYSGTNPLDDLMAALFAHLTQVIELSLVVLVEGGDSHI